MIPRPSKRLWNRYWRRGRDRKLNRVANKVVDWAWRNWTDEEWDRLMLDLKH